MNKIVKLFAILCPTFAIFGIGFCQEPAEIPQKALQLLNQNQPAEAEKLFRKHLDTHPDDPQALYYLGVSLHFQSQYKAAIEVLERVLALGPQVSNPQLEPSRLQYFVSLLHFQSGDLDSAQRWLGPLVKEGAVAPAYLLQGRIDFAKRDYESAERHISRALQLELGNPAEAHYQLGLIHAIRGNPGKAAASFETALAQQPSNPDILLKLGDAYFQLKDIPRVEKLSRDVLDKQPGSAMAHYNLGRAEYVRGNLEKAGGHFFRATELGKRPEYSHSLAQVRIQLKQPQQAIAALKDNLRLDPKAVSPRLQLAGLLFQALNMKGAEEEYRNIIEISPENMQALFGLAFTLVAQGNETGAVDAFRKAWATDPDLLKEMIVSAVISAQEHPGYTEIAGRLLRAVAPAAAENSLEFIVARQYLTAGRGEKSLEWIDRYLANGAPDANVHLLRGSVLRMLGRREEAEKELLAIDLASPLGVHALHQLAVLAALYEENQERRKADEYLDRALALDPNHFQALVLKAKRQIKDLNLSEAEQLLKRAVSVQPERPEAYYVLFTLYRRSGKNQEAEEALHQHNKLKAETALPPELEYP